MRVFGVGENGGHRGVEIRPGRIIELILFFPKNHRKIVSQVEFPQEFFGKLVQALCRLEPSVLLVSSSALQQICALLIQKLLGPIPPVLPNHDGVKMRRAEFHD